MFFVKQNTAYEQRISDWSSDVCSSDLGNDQHISEKLENLERDGYIVIGSTDRSGTRYEVRLPEAVPSVRERMAEAQEVEPAAVDYFGDPERRAESFERDGWRCRYCGETVTASTATLDHMVPQDRKSTRLNSRH